LTGGFFIFTQTTDHSQCFTFEGVGANIYQTCPNTSFISRSRVDNIKEFEADIKSGTNINFVTNIYDCHLR